MWGRVLLRLLLGLFAIALFIVTVLGWIVFSKDGLHLAMKLNRDYLQLPLQIGSIEGRFLGPLQLNNIHYQGEIGQVEIDHLQIVWNLEYLLNGEFSVESLKAKKVSIHLHERINHYSKQTIKLPYFYLPLRSIIRSFSIEQLNLEYSKQHLQMENIFLSIQGSRSLYELLYMTGDLQQARLESSGIISTKGNYPLSLDTLLSSKQSDKSRIKGSIFGDLRKLYLIQHWSGFGEGGVELTLTDILDEPRWEGEIELSQLSVTEFFPESPAGELYADAGFRGDLEGSHFIGRTQFLGDEHFRGLFDLSWSPKRSELSLHRVEFEAPKRDSFVELSGVWWPATDFGRVDIEMGWSHLRWPLDEKNLWFSSRAGSAKISGNLDAYRINLDTSRPWPQIPNSRWRAVGEGGRHGLDIESLQIDLFANRLKAKGRVDWGDNEFVQWSAVASTEGFNPQFLSPNLRGELEAEVFGEGLFIYREEDLQMHYRIDSLTGELDGHLLSGSGEIDWLDKKLKLADIRLTSNKAKLDLNGSIGQEWELFWQFNSNDMNMLFSHWQGELLSSGSLLGDFHSPQLKATLMGEGLQRYDLRGETIKGTLTTDWNRWQELNLDLSIVNLSLGEIRVNHLSLGGVGESGDHQVYLKLDGSEVQVELGAGINYRKKELQVHLNQFDIFSKRHSAWKMEGEVVASWSDEQLRSDEICLRSDIEESSFCLFFGRQQENWVANLYSEKFTLDLLEPYLPEGTDFDGTASLSGLASLSELEHLKVNMQLSLQEGSVSYPLFDSAKNRWGYHKGIIKFNLNSERGLGYLELALNGGNQLQGDFLLPEFSPFHFERKQQAVDANLTILLNELSAVEEVVPEISNLNGDLFLHLTAKGTLAEPQLDGWGDLQSGSFEVPRLGIAIDPFDLRVEPIGEGEVRLDASISSGEGLINLFSVVKQGGDSNWSGRMKLDGENFLLANDSNAEIWISPEIELTLQEREVELNGKVDIPYAKIFSEEINKAIQPSTDIVIIDAGSGTTDSSSVDPWNIRTDIHLTLGDRVHFNGYGFNGRLGGGVKVIDFPGEPTLARGVILIPEGRYRAYGQNLRVEDGSLRFTGGPIVNPGLDIRAEREIGDIKVGLQASGSLQQPKVSLFSEPAMGETERLSYLVLGRPIEESSEAEGERISEAGVALGLAGGDLLAGAIGKRLGLDDIRIESAGRSNEAHLVMGHYLTPKLYVSYGVGLMEAVDTLSLRYQLNKRWQLRGESGEHQGGDLLYNLERD